MKVSDEGLELIKRFEGCKLTAYKDSVGVLTIGYGHTIGVRVGDTCTQEQADDWLRDDSHRAETCIQQCVSADLTQGEFDALVSFVFNLGCGNFRGSRLLQCINDGRMDEAAEQFKRWNKARGQVLAGLTARREAEAERFQA